ncbi:hypothetical protein O7606_04885 [Micromonospora sp. WMMD882]|uniref:hypothetical protein n=1 Tax=Micromonospora sp. WMMD882 TaxID=3015151 RepID=UPI00248C5BF4|nr:hypothetical protein [Micromonospora sp. WMMD882]WBB80731.1 hypothetical protein O7606_04885 [Micromonospora sp. WMMD882]
MDHTNDAVRAGRCALDRAVPALLDIEAGLRDILLPTRYAALPTNLAALLDPETALTTLIHPSPPPPRPASSV